MICRSVIHDRRGASSVQMLILAVGLALAGSVAVKALGSRIGERNRCTGEEIKALGLGAAGCAGDDEAGLPASLTPPPPPPPQQSATSGPDQPPDNQPQPEPEFDAGEELLAIASDIIGITDAQTCLTEGDVSACIMTATVVSPFKAANIAFKLVKNAARIKRAVERFLAARRAKRAQAEAERAKKAKEEAERAKKAEEEARKAKEAEEAARRAKKPLSPRACKNFRERFRKAVDVTDLAMELLGVILGAGGIDTDLNGGLRPELDLEKPPGIERTFPGPGGDPRLNEIMEKIRRREPITPDDLRYLAGRAGCE